MRKLALQVDSSKSRESANREDKAPPSPKATSDDPCLDAVYALENYGTCCGNGGVRQPGHSVSNL